MKRFIIVNMETALGLPCPRPDRAGAYDYIYGSQAIAQTQAEKLANQGADRSFVVFELVPRTINRLPAPSPSITRIVQPGEDV